MEIISVMQKVAKVIQQRLRFQSPVKTGKLRDSIVVRVVETKDKIDLVVDFKDYGVFTDSGTGNYFKPSNTAKWNKAPGKGKGGIRPRYWTNLDESTRINVNQMIKTEVTKGIKQELFKL